MTVQTSATLKGYFQSGDKPTQDQFSDLIDTLFSVSGSEDITNIQVGLDSYIFATTYGVVADDGIDHSTEWQAAHDAAVLAGKPLLMPKGTVLGNLVYDSNFIMIGAGRDATILKCPAGKNQDVLQSRNVSSLWGTGSNNGSNRVVFCKFTVHGNRDNNTSGNGISHYGGWPTMHDLFITETAEQGLRTESGAGAIDSPYDREGWFRDIRIKRTGKHGWYFSGPGDSHIDNVFLTDISLATALTYDGIFISGSQANARWSKVHSYNHSNLGKPRYGLNVTSTGQPNKFTESYFEGSGVGNAYLGAANCELDALLTNSYSDADNLIIAATACKFTGSLGGPADSNSIVGIRLGVSGHTASNCIIDCKASAQESGLVDFTYTGGRNNIKINALQTASYPTSVTWIGTPASTDIVQIQTNKDSMYAPVQGDHGSVRLTYNTSTRLDLSAVNGGFIRIVSTGMLVPVQATGTFATKVASSGLTVNTLYHIYAYWDYATSNFAILEASTTVPALDTGSGIYTKTGDTSRTYVGSAYCFANASNSPIWRDSTFFRGVYSHYNPRIRSATNRALALVVTNATNNIVVRLTVDSIDALADGMKVKVASVGGTTEANGTWPIDISGTATMDLTGSVFVNPYTSGGTVTNPDITSTATSVAELNTLNRVVFIGFPESAVDLDFNGYVSNSTADSTATTQIVVTTITGSGPTTVAGTTQATHANDQLMNASISGTFTPATLGCYLATVYGAVSANTGTWYLSDSTCHLRATAQM